MPVTAGMDDMEIDKDEDEAPDEGNLVIMEDVDDENVMGPVPDFQRAPLEDHQALADQRIAVNQAAARANQQMNQDLKVSLVNLVESIKLVNNPTVSFFHIIYFQIFRYWPHAYFH